MLEELKSLRKEILKVSNHNKAGHIPSAFSILEILFCLYNKVLTNEDSFLLSKGHGCLALYSMFWLKEFITKEEFYSFSQYNSLLGGHPDRNKLKQIEISAGSLGHGLPIAVGMALSKKIKNEDGKIFCLVGDGECNEGTTWESSLLASTLKLNNLVCIIDNNNSQVRAVPTSDLENKFGSFGFNVLQCNGHNLDELTNKLQQKSEKPLAIICNTIKGFGITEMETDMFSWHHGPPTDEKLKLFLEELDKK